MKPFSLWEKTALPLLAALALSACAVPGAQNLPRPVQRDILNLSLGQSLRSANKEYPGLLSCPSEEELSGQVRRVHLSSGCVKNLPDGVQEMRLGFKDAFWLGVQVKELSEIEVIYNAVFSRQKPADALAADVSQIYGPPRRSEGRFWWADGNTVMRVFYEEISGDADSGGAVSLRTSFQLIDTSLFHK